jgi:hypothetical protein
MAEGLQSAWRPYAAVRGVFERAGLSDPIHVGHDIGTGPHEWPRIVPRAILCTEDIRRSSAEPTDAGGRNPPEPSAS